MLWEAPLLLRGDAPGAAGVALSRQGWAGRLSPHQGAASCKDSEQRGSILSLLSAGDWGGCCGAHGVSPARPAGGQVWLPGCCTHPVSLPFARLSPNPDSRAGGVGGAPHLMAAPEMGREICGVCPARHKPSAHPKHGRTSVPSGAHGAGESPLCGSPRNAERGKEGLLRSPALAGGNQAGGSGGDRESILPTAPRSRTNMKCSSIGASKSAPAAGSGRGWRQLPCRAVGSAPPLLELQERGLIKKEKKK